MPNFDELKTILAPVLTKAGVTPEVMAKVFDDKAALSEEEKNVLLQQTDALTTLQAAEADQGLRNNVIRSTMEAIEGKVLERVKGLKNRKIEPTILDGIWKQKHLSEKFGGIIELLDRAETPADMVAKSEFEALQHKFKEAQSKAKSGSKAWEEIIGQKDAAIAEWQKKHESAVSQHAQQLKLMEDQRIDDDLLSHVRGKISGESWFVKATESEIIKQARQRAQFVRKDGGLLARNPENPDVPIFGENKSAELTPKQLVIAIANEMKVLDKQGAGGGSKSVRVPAGAGGSAQRQQQRDRNRGKQQLDPKTQGRVNSNADQFKKMGVQQ
jgi:hypothetical protein